MIRKDKYPHLILNNSAGLLSIGIHPNTDEETKGLDDFLASNPYSYDVDLVNKRIRDGLYYRDIAFLDIGDGDIEEHLSVLESESKTNKSRTQKALAKIEEYQTANPDEEDSGFFPWFKQGKE